MAEIYTDGSVYPNPGTGVGGACRHNKKFLSGMLENITSNTAELIGILCGTIIAHKEDTLCTDSFVVRSWLEKKGHIRNCRENILLSIARNLISEKNLKVKQIQGCKNLCHDVVEAFIKSPSKGDMADGLKRTAEQNQMRDETLTVNLIPDGHRAFNQQRPCDSIPTLT